MAIVTLPNIGGGSDPATINVSVLNGKVDPLATDYNGNIQNVNIASDAGIVDTKLATISTAGKVSGAALTSLASIPSGAGVIPSANLPTSNTDNLLINGNFDVWQRGTSFISTTTPANSDDTFLVDRWILLSDGNDIVDVTRQTSGAPEGSRYYIRLDVETANKKFGIFQPLESADSAYLLNQEVSLSFYARVTNSSIANIRAAVVSWSSTADSITSDIVSAWGAAGTDPTLVANWTYENTPSSLAMTTSFVKQSITNITIDTASMANVGVFIWCDDVTVDVGDFLEISQVALSIGTTSPTLKPLKFSEEISNCQRYYFKTFPYATAPAQSAGNDGCISYRVAVSGVMNQSQRITFPVQMRTTPSVTFYNPGAANTAWRNLSDAADSGASSVDSTTDSDAGITIENAQAAGDAQGDLVGVHLTASAEL